MQKQLGTENSKSNEGRQEKNEETVLQRSLTERLVRSRLQWVGHVERMEDDRIANRAAELREQDRRRRGRPRLRWEDLTRFNKRTVLREVRGRQERRNTGSRRQETEEGGKDYQMRR